MKILLTAFEAFGGEAINPTQEALKLLPDSIGGAEILRMTVPVTFSGAAGFSPGEGVSFPQFYSLLRF